MSLIRPETFGEYVWLVTFIAVWGGIAVRLFITAFTNMRLYRLIEDTATSTIRSTAIGHSEISGEVVAQTSFAAPITGERSVLSECVVKRHEPGSKGSSWKEVDTVTVSVPFSVRDETGEIAIDPRGAKIFGKTHRFVGDGDAQALTDALHAWNRAPANLSSYAFKDITPPDPSSGEPLKIRVLPTGDVRVEKKTLNPGDRVFIAGTARSSQGALTIGKRGRGTFIIVTDVEEQGLVFIFKLRMILSFIGAAVSSLFAAGILTLIIAVSA